MPNQNATSTMDNDVINLAKAIRQTESGGDFNAKGGSGESGAYQWMPNTWKAHAKQALGNENAEMTPSNQNAVAYTVLKSWKDQGLNPAQIAAKWNSGSETGWENKRGVNSAGIAYDVPKYVKSVTDAYQTVKQGGTPQMDPNNPSSLSGTQIVEQPNPDKLANKLNARAEQFTNAGREDGYFGESILGRVGAVAGGINDVVGAAISPIFNKVVDTVSDIDAVQKFAQTKPVSGALDVANVITEGVGEDYKAFEQANPKTGRFLADVGNVASLVPIGKGAQMTKNAAVDTTKLAARTALPNTSENIMNRIARLDPTDARKFEALAGESHGKYLSRTGNITTAEEVLQNESRKFAKSIQDVDDAISTLEGKFKNSHVATALKELAEREARIGVPGEDTYKISSLVRKHEQEGLTMAEINEVKRLFERNVKLDFQKQNLPEGLERATRVDKSLREWQFKQAEKLGLKNLPELNKQTQLAKFIVDKLGKKITGGTGNNAISLTDWIIMSGLDPNAIAGFLAKKAVFGQGGQAKLARLTAPKAQGQIRPKFGGKTGLPALIPGRDYRTATEMGAPRKPKTGIIETPPKSINRSSSIEDARIKEQSEMKLLPAPRSTAQGVPTVLPRSIRETNIGTDELKNAKINQTRTEGTQNQQKEKRKSSKASSIVSQKEGLVSSKKGLESEAKKYKSAEEFVKEMSHSRVMNPKFNAVAESPEFKSWFGKSKLVDPAGNVVKTETPTVFYHRSSTDFDNFLSRSELEAKGVKLPDYRDTDSGFYFSRKDAGDYYGSKKYAVALKAENPKQVSGDISSISDTQIQKLKSQGYDAIESPDEIVVFSKDQIWPLTRNGQPIGKTKSQLTDIWNKAHKKSGLIPLKKKHE